MNVIWFISGTPIAGGGPLGTLSFGVPASTTIHNPITGTPQIGFGTANLSKPSTSGLGFGVTGAAASATTSKLLMKWLMYVVYLYFIITVQ